MPPPAPARLRDDPDFRRFWAARVISLGGSALTLLALPVLMYEVSGSPLLTGLVAAFEALPYLLFGLGAGALADRLDRKRVMVLADLVDAAVLASVVAAAWAGALTVPHLLAAAFLVPAGFVFFDAAQFGAVPALVGRERIATANAAVSGAGTVAEIAVPAAGGALLATVGAPALLAVDALTYVVSALLVRALRRPLQDPGRTRPPLGARALAADVREGLRFLWGQATVRAMTIAGTAQSIGGGAFVGQLVVWADRQLGVSGSDARLGVLYAAWGAGALLAAAVLPALLRRYAAARVTLAALPASAALCVLSALAPRWELGAALLLGWGAAYMLVVTNSITYRQQVTPEALMSRVSATGRMLSFGLGYPLGSLLGGVVAERAGPVAGMLAGAAVLVVGAAGAWASPLRSGPARGTRSPEHHG